MKFVALMTVSLALAGAIMPSVPAHAAEDGAGIANPASTYCVSIGGQSIVRQTPSGAVGYCRLPDGKVREEWALFRNSRKPSPKRRTHRADMTNPAAAYCGERRGRLETRRGPGGPTTYCHLPDGRVVEQWKLFRDELNGRAR